MCIYNQLQWNLLRRTPSGPAVLSFQQPLSEAIIMYTGVLSACPLLGGLSSFGVSFIELKNSQVLNMVHNVLK